MHDEPLPDGILREASAPERLVVVWADGDTSVISAVAEEIGAMAVRLPPQDTRDLVEIAGPPAVLLICVDALDDAAVAALDAVRALAPKIRVCALAGHDSGSAGLLRALRSGLSEVVDPFDPDALHRVLGAAGSEHVERVLAVGAHPDDVEIGCGATLLRHRAHGHSVTVLTLSRGAVGGCRDERGREAVGAAVAMGAELLMGDLPDTRMEDAHEMISLVEAVIAHVRPTTVYVHSKADNHQDHRAVHEATLIAARRIPQLFCYQSPSSRNGFAPTKFVPVAETIEAKVDVLSHYKSQSTRHYLEPDLVLATARYWARQLTHTRYAEPFEVVRASELD